MKLDAIGAKVVSARATQKSDVLILLESGSNKEGFTEEVKRVVEGLSEVRANSKKVTLEYRDLDPLATEEEYKVLNPNQKGLKLTVVVLPEDETRGIIPPQGWDGELSNARPCGSHEVP